MIQAILFDVDGVLVNGGLFSKQLKRDFGITIPNDFFEQEFQPALVGKADLKDILITKVKEWGWAKSVDDLLDYWFKAEHQIDQELIEIVKHLKSQDIICAVVTNQEKHRAAYITEKMGFGELFDGVFASGNVGFKKPQIEFFSHVLDKIGCQGEETLYFDDTAGYLAGAKSVGIHAYLFKGAEELKKVLATHNVL